MDDGKDGEETNNEIECDVNDDVTFINVPIEKDEAKDERGEANGEVFFEVCFFQIAGLAQQIS